MEGFKVHTEIEVRFRDMDAMGHVNNAVYLTYFEQGRIAHWRALSEAAKFKQTMFILAEATVSFKSPAVMGNVLVLGIRVGEMRNSSFTYEYRLVEKESGRLVAEGTTAQVFYDYSNRKSIKIADDLRAAVEALEGKSFPIPEK